MPDRPPCPVTEAKDRRQRVGKGLCSAGTGTYSSHLSDPDRTKPGWLNLSDAGLSPTRYWRGPRSQEVGEEGEYT